MRLYLLYTSIYILFFGATSFAQRAEPNYIMGYAWGTSYQTCLKDLKLYKTKCKVEKNAAITFQRSGDEVKLEFRAGLNQVVRTRSFPLNELDKGMAHLNKSLEELVESYGNYHKSQSQPKEIFVFEWKFSKTTLMLIYYIPSNTVTIEYSLI